MTQPPKDLWGLQYKRHLYTFYTFKYIHTAFSKQKREKINNFKLQMESIMVSN